MLVGVSADICHTSRSNSARLQLSPRRSSKNSSSENSFAVSTISCPLRRTLRLMRSISISPWHRIGSECCPLRPRIPMHRATSSWKLNGFTTQSSAPALRQRTRSATSLRPVSTSTEISLNFARTCRSTSVPSISGKLRSSTIRSGWPDCTCSIAATPSPTQSTSWPSNIKPFCRNSPNALSSSTTKTFMRVPHCFIQGKATRTNSGRAFRSSRPAITRRLFHRPVELSGRLIGSSFCPNEEFLTESQIGPKCCKIRHPERKVLQFAFYSLQFAHGDHATAKRGHRLSFRLHQQERLFAVL